MSQRKSSDKQEMNSLSGSTQTPQRNLKQWKLKLKRSNTVYNKIQHYGLISYMILECTFIFNLCSSWNSICQT